MKKGAGVIVFIVLVGASLYFLFNRHNSSAPLPSRVKENPAQNSVPNKPADRIAPAASSNSGNAGSISIVPNKSIPSEISPSNVEATAASPALVSGELENPKLPPDTVLENMRSAVRLYSSMFAGNPIGTNPEITGALTGNNPKQVNFIKPDSGLRINSRGELIDSWGTPFFFHQLSGTEMEIRSAGPDKIMWTTDDLVMK